jgi:hypothetical protein
MIYDVKEHFLDIWFSSSIEDCGDINICTNINYTCDYDIPKNDLKKLNKEHWNDNDNYDSIINEPQYRDGNREYNSPTRNQPKSIISKRSHRNRTQNSTIEFISRKNSPKYKSLQQNINPNYHERKMSLLSKNCNIYVSRPREKQILLDSFTKSRINR